MSTMQVALPEAIIERAKGHALGQVLSGWSHDDADGNEFILSYEDVLDILRQPENEGQVCDERITVWEAFEYHGGEFIAEHIEDLYRTFTELAEDSMRAERTQTINLIASSVDNPALQTVPSEMALRILVATLRVKDEGDE
jgi:hypothetical protein